MPSQEITRNRHPWRIAGTIALAILLGMIGLAAASVVDGEVLGALFVDILISCVVLGFWARRSRRMWAPLGWTVRFMIVAVIVIPVLNLFRFVGQGAP
jgi:uncharacterized membrane protein YccC